jgi:hypothetical protein
MIVALSSGCVYWDEDEAEEQRKTPPLSMRMGLEMRIEGS